MNQLYTPHTDPEIAQFQSDLLESLRQAKRGDFAAIHSPEQITARRIGRPPLATPKQAVKVRLDADILTALRASGRGWQTRVNALLKEAVQTGKFAA